MRLAAVLGRANLNLDMVDKGNGGSLDMAE